MIFAPLVGAVINWLFGKKMNSELFSGAVACTAVGVSCVVAFMIAFGIGTGEAGALFADKPILDQIWTWIQVGNFRADFGLGMDRLSAIYACFITFVALLIHIFATGYMHGDKGFYRFFAYLNLFMFSMLTLVLADNFLLMFVGWEGVGLCSYLLIGYYIKRDEARRAAKKAFVMNRIGDWGVLMGMFLIFTMTGSISFYDKVVGGETVQSSLVLLGQMAQEPFAAGAIFAGGITTIAVLLFIGATGKSAQIPLFTWLPDAMAGPTPVSALIHAATMVTAGVYMVVRCNAIYQNAPTAMFIVAIIGAATAIFAATIGLAQNDIKKVLAYSTVSQLGYMFLACGVGAFGAAIFHVMTHAFFKALLFLGSGSVIHGMHHEQDMRRMGNLKKYMPITFITMMTGWLAISGIPIFAGFFSKDEILYKTYTAPNLPPSWNLILWVVGIVTAVLTAVYMTRMMVMTFWGAERFHLALPDGNHPHDAAHAEENAFAEGDAHDAQTSHGHSAHGGGGGDDLIDEHDDEEHHALAPDFKPHESPWTMTVPLIVLAILSTVGGLVGVPYALSGGAITNYFERTLEPVVERVEPKHAPATNHKIVATEHGTVADYGTTEHSANEHGASSSHAPAAAEHSASGGNAPVETAQTEPHAATGHATKHAEHSAEEISTERLLAGFSVVVAALGLISGFLYFRRNPLLRMPKILENKWSVDELYNGAIVNPLTNLSREGLWKGFDVGVVDGIVNGIGHFVAALGSVARGVQVGFVRSYAAFMLFGALIVIGYFIYYGFRLIG
ncbi:MAG: NADH-quinone oxidoreductase subunit L [Acidobacteria bacterium]|nr:NADH-quinone oxidoreductase subunit L [Acidobacteriota bacterium]